MLDRILNSSGFYTKHFNFILLKHAPLKYSIFLTLSLPVRRWAEANIDLPSNSNISKQVRVNVAFTSLFDKLSDDMQVDRPCTCSFLATDF